jgi:hypothetical protein
MFERDGWRLDWDGEELMRYEWLLRTSLTKITHRSGVLEENGFARFGFDALGVVEDAIVFLIASIVALPAAVALVVRCIVGFDVEAFGVTCFVWVELDANAAQV